MSPFLCLTWDLMLKPFLLLLMLICCTYLCRNGNRGIYLYFFGEDGKTRMPMRKFDDFLKSLHDEIVRLEFAHYDYQGKVCHYVTSCTLPCM